MENTTETKTDNCTTRTIWPDIGRVGETCGVNEWFSCDEKRREEFISQCWRRYIAGDWGELGEEDKTSNDAAMFDGSRILASYTFQSRKIWIITEARGDDGRRAHTTILFPEEY